MKYFMNTVCLRRKITIGGGSPRIDTHFTGGRFCRVDGGIHEAESMTAVLGSSRAAIPHYLGALGSNDPD
jgi:hypothetical protein